MCPGNSFDGNSFSMITTKNTTIGKYDHHSTAHLLRAFETGPERIRKAIDGLSDAELKLQVVPGKWSIFEIVIHVAEGEIIGACRFRQALADHPEPFPYYNEAVWARVMQYQQQSIQFLRDNILMFEMMRRTTADLLKRCTDEQWQKTGTHPMRGTMTVRQLLELYADHSERHIVQILERRELMGKSRAMDILLEERLY